MTWFHWALLSAGFAAATAILAKVGVAGVDSTVATGIRTAVVLLASITIAATTGKVPELRRLPNDAWVALTLSGLATAASWLCYFRALQLGEASRVAPVDKLSVVFVVVFAAMFLGEPLSVSKAAGACLVLAGIVLLAN